MASEQEEAEKQIAMALEFYPDLLQVMQQNVPAQGDDAQTTYNKNCALASLQGIMQVANHPDDIVSMFGIADNDGILAFQTQARDYAKRAAENREQNACAYKAMLAKGDAIAILRILLESGSKEALAQLKEYAELERADIRFASHEDAEHWNAIEMDMDPDALTEDERQTGVALADKMKELMEHGYAMIRYHDRETTWNKIKPAFYRSVLANNNGQPVICLSRDFLANLIYAGVHMLADSIDFDSVSIERLKEQLPLVVEVPVKSLGKNPADLNANPPGDPTSDEFAAWLSNAFGDDTEPVKEHYSFQSFQPAKF